MAAVFDFNPDEFQAKKKARIENMRKPQGALDPNLGGCN